MSSVAPPPGDTPMGEKVTTAPAILAFLSWTPFLKIKTCRLAEGVYAKVTEVSPRSRSTKSSRSGIKSIG